MATQHDSATASARPLNVNCRWNWRAYKNA